MQQFNLQAILALICDFYIFRIQFNSDKIPLCLSAAIPVVPDPMKMHLVYSKQYLSVRPSILIASLIQKTEIIKNKSAPKPLSISKFQVINEVKLH